MTVQARRLDLHADLYRHGGAVDAAARLFPKAPPPWLDLSTGINAVAYPVGDVATDAWARLPGATSLARLEATARTAYGVTLGADVVAAPGSQAIIQQLPRLFGGGDVRLLGPTYGEYRRVFECAEARVRLVDHIDALARADVAVIVNPNNPDGRMVGAEALVALTRRVGALVIDEAFADLLAPDRSFARHVLSARVVVLRSFGKAYGLAGARLGFAITSAALGNAVRDMLGPWPISGPTIAVGTRALDDAAWLDGQRVRLAGDGERLDFLLRLAGATPLGGTPLFRLVEHPQAASLFLALARNGILARPFADAPTWLRFGLPGCERDWQRLDTALRTLP